MIECKLAICARSIVVDRFSNEFSVHGVVDEISAVGFPLVLPTISTLFLCSRQDSDPEEADLLISLKHYSENSESEPESPELRIPTRFNFQGKLKLRMVHSMTGLPINHPGLLRFSLQTEEGQVLGKWEIIVNKVEADAPQFAMDVHAG